MNENNLFPNGNGTENNDLVPNTSTDSLGNATPNGPVEPVAPVAPVEPIVTPVTPVEPTVTPVTPVEPTVTPVTPVEPTVTPVTPVEPTVTPVTPVEPVAPVAPAESLETSDHVSEAVKTFTPDSTEEHKEEKMKKNLLLPILLIVLAIAILGGVAYYFFFKKSNSIEVTTKAFEKLKSNLVEVSDSFSELKEGTKKVDALTAKGDLTLDVKSAYLESQNNEDYNNLVAALKDMVVEYTLGVDSKTKNMNVAVTIKALSEMVSSGYVVNDGKVYLLLNGKYVDVTEDLKKDLGSVDSSNFEELLKELEDMDAWHIYDVITSAFASSLKEEYFETEKTTITVDKKDVDVTKHILKITKKNAADIINETIKKVSKDEKVNSIFKKLGVDLSTQKVEKEYFEDMEPLVINFYAKKNDLLKIELVEEYESTDWNTEETVSNSYEISYTFGKTTDVISVVGKQNKETTVNVSVELTVSKNSLKIELYQDSSKIGTLEFNATKDSMNLALNANVMATEVVANISLKETEESGKNKLVVSGNVTINTIEYLKFTATTNYTLEEKYVPVDVSGAVTKDTLTRAEQEELESLIENFQNMFSGFAYNYLY